MVKTEESAEAVAPLHGGGRALRRSRALQKPVVESLVVSLAVIVHDVLPREEAQVAVTERDHSIETFLFDRPNKPCDASSCRAVDPSRRRDDARTNVKPGSDAVNAGASGAKGGSASLNDLMDCGAVATMAPTGWIDGSGSESSRTT